MVEMEEKKRCFPWPLACILFVSACAVFCVASYVVADGAANARDMRLGSSATSSTSEETTSRRVVMDPDATQEQAERTRKEADPFEFGEGYDDSNTSYSRFVGTITNVSDTTHYFVMVRGAFADADNNVIDTTWTYACGQEGLRPGESTKFTLSVDYDSRISQVIYEVGDYQ